MTPFSILWRVTRITIGKKISQCILLTTASNVEYCLHDPNSVLADRANTEVL